MLRLLSVRRALLALLLCILAVAQLGPLTGPIGHVSAERIAAPTAARAQVTTQTLATGAFGAVRIEGVVTPGKQNGTRLTVQGANNSNVVFAPSDFYVEGSKLSAFEGAVDIYRSPRSAAAKPVVSRLYMALAGHFKLGPYQALAPGRYILSVTDARGKNLFAPRTFQVAGPSLRSPVKGLAANRISPRLAGPAADPTCPPDALGPASLYSVFVLGDLTLRHSDFQGAAAAGGNVFLGDAFSIGESLISADTAALSQTNGGPDVLIAGGNLTASYYDPNVGVTQYGNIQHGNAVYSGTYTLEPITVTPFMTPTVVHAPSPIDFTAAAAKLTGLSDYYASLAPLVVTRPGADRFITLIGASPTLNSFTISSHDLSLMSTRGVSITAPAGSTVLVNVIPDAGSSGTAADLGYAKQFPLNGGIDSRHVLYNINQATTLSFVYEDLYGSILAPRAAVSFMNGALFGTLVGKTLLDVAPSNSTGQVELPPNSTGQVNLPPFQGCIPTLSTPTAVPTTAVPTTAVPTTAVPTTAVPTTAVPTTAVPTTAVPTTAVPTTAVPTTAVPTTAVPTTAVPNSTGVPTTAVVGTTAVPTTAVPTTAVPTTAVPTTAVPTTAVPTTAVPTTAVPTTAVPTMAAPTTAVPTTAAPTTAVPTTAAVVVAVAAVPTFTPYPSATPAPTYTPYPTYTPLATTAPATPQAQVAGVTRPVSTKVVTITRYVTKTKYVTKPRYVTKTKYVTRYIVQTTHRVVTVQKVNTVVRYKTQVKVKVVTKVNNKTVVHNVTKVLVRTKTVVHNVTRIHEVAGLRIVRHPVTGRFGGLQQAWHGASAIPPVEARIGIARLGVSWAPVWARDFTSVGGNAFTYDIVPFYGVTRFKSSAAFGQPGLSMISGHDDEFGQIFRNLGQTRTGDAIVVTQGSHGQAHVYRYIVKSVSVVTPDNVAMLNAPYARPTLALISCTPYMVDTHRVVVIAELQR